MRYFIIFYIAKYKYVGHKITGQCTMKCDGGESKFLNEKKTKEEIFRLNKDNDSLEVEQIVLTGIHEITVNEYNDWTA